ncbi:MAG: DUF998 domain-containing protein [Chloroflexi bacterium]|nr:DUF998 domain-containing protein [Chloroflexota bacterium]
MDTWSRRLTIVAGFLGAATITLGAILTAFPYVGGQGQSYSPFNHFVSELGHTQESELAGLFNVALIVGGLLFALFMIGVGLRFTGIMRYVIAIGGALAGISGMLVGLFPMDVDLATHGQVALGFFEGSLLVLIVFSFYVGFSGQRVYPRWLALVALPMILSNAVFVSIVLNGGEGALAAPEGGRETFWLTTISEWGVIIFLMVWVTVIAIWRAARTES